MSFLALVTLANLALLQFVAFQCGTMRGKHQVPPGTTVGPEEFNRHYRAQANLMENLLVFLPSVWLLGYYGDARLAGVVGTVFLLARVAYHRAYISEPTTRLKAFLVGIACSAVALLGAVVSILIDVVAA